MRTDRLLPIIWLLCAHGGLSAADLAARLEVSRRTLTGSLSQLMAVVPS